MSDWAFHTFISDRGVIEFEEWRKGLPARDRMRIREFINYLKTQTVWNHGDCKRYKGSEKIYELVIKCGKIQYRPLGFFGVGERVFTILIGAQEKDWKLVPPNALMVAEARRVKILKDGKYATNYL